MERKNAQWHDVMQDPTAIQIHELWTEGVKGVPLYLHKKPMLWEEGQRFGLVIDLEKNGYGEQGLGSRETDGEFRLKHTRSMARTMYLEYPTLRMTMHQCG